MQETMETAFDFTSEDLAYNQQRQLSPRQAAQLARTNRRQKVTLTLVTLVCAALALALAYPFIQAFSLDAASLGQAIGALVLAGLSLLFFSGLFNQVDAGVKMAEGPVQFVSGEEAIHNGDHLETSTVFYVVVGGERVPVRTGQYQTLTQGHVYRLYLGAAPSLGLLSIEYVGPPTAVR
jgi:hypothetical protein